MILNSFLPWLLAVGAAAIPHAKDERATTATVSGATIYAFGKGISGRPILSDSDGNAFVSNAPVQPANLSSVTWTISTKGTADWTVTLNSTNSTSTTPGTFYIIPTSDAYEPVGFLLNDTTPTGAVTTPFWTYGQVVQYEASDVLVSNFWAEGIEGTDQYQIKWNSAGSLKDGATPVLLKTLSTTQEAASTVTTT